MLRVPRLHLGEGFAVAHKRDTEEEHNATDLEHLASVLTQIM